MTTGRVVTPADSPYDGESKVTVFTLPVSGAVRVFGPEMRLVATPEFQRLACIRQLGTASLVFRGAMHTRFEHSLGALHQAEAIIQRVNSNPICPEEIDRPARRLIRLTALLHDVLHIPFGHTLEDELGLLQRHDENRDRRARLLTGGELGRELRDVLDQRGEFERLIHLEDALVAPEARDEAIAGLDYPFAADIIGNTVCADMLDYVPRDLAACGMPVALGDRFLDFFTITPQTILDPVDRRRMALNLEKRGMPRPDVESEVVKLLTYRYELVERVYFHHGKNAASVMLGRAVLAAGWVSGGPHPDPDDQFFDGLSDELLLRALADPAMARALGYTRRRRPPDQKLASELASRILNRRLYKIAYMGVYDDFAERAQDLYDRFKHPPDRTALEDRLANAAGLTPGDVLVHLPSPKMLLKLAEVRVLTQENRVITLEEWDSRHSRRASALNDAHIRLWRVTVYVRPEATVEQKALVRAAAEDIFGERSRYVPTPRTQQYLRAIFDMYADVEGWQLADARVLDSLAAFTVSDENPEDVRGLIRTAIDMRRNDST